MRNPKTRFPYLTKDQQSFIKRNIKMPYSVIVTVILTVFIKYMNEYVFDFKKGDNPKLYVVQDKLIDNLVKHVVIDVDIKSMIKKLEEK